MRRNDRTKYLSVEVETVRLQCVMNSGLPRERIDERELLKYVLWTAKACHKYHCSIELMKIMPV